MKLLNTPPRPDVEIIEHLINSVRVYANVIHVNASGYSGDEKAEQHAASNRMFLLAKEGLEMLERMEK